MTDTYTYRPMTDTRTDSAPDRPDQADQLDAPDRLDRAGRGARIPPGLERSRDAKRTTHRWARWLHVYTSMVALVLVLFFGITGLTLNHPSWTFGDDVDTTVHTGTLEVETVMDDGTVDFLSVSEYVRDAYGVAGSVDSFGAVNGEGSIAYKNAGYAADLFFDVDSGSFELTIEQQGWVGVMNDLHKGRDTASAWSWVIDISAIFLVAIALTGLVMQFFLRKRRRSALTWTVIGGLATIVVVVVTLR